MSYIRFIELKELKSICEFLEITPEDFLKQYGSGLDNKYTAKEISESDYYTELLERSSSSYGSDSDAASKGKMFLNFVMGKGRKIRTLGKELERALVAKVTTPFIIQRRIENAVHVTPEQRANLKKVSDEKVRAYGEIEDAAKDKMDAIADGDSRLRKISSIVKNTAAIKASKTKITFLDAQDDIDKIKAEREKISDRTQAVRTTTHNLNDQIADDKSKANAQVAKGKDDHTDDQKHAHIKELDEEIEGYKKLLADYIEQHKHHPTTVQGYNTPEEAEKKREAIRKVKSGERELKNKILSARIEKARYQNKSADIIKKLEAELAESEAKLNPKEDS